MKKLIFVLVSLLIVAGLFATLFLTENKSLIADQFIKNYLADSIAVSLIFLQAVVEVVKVCLWPTWELIGVWPE